MRGCPWCNLTEEESKWLLLDTDSWSVYLADEQDYIGRCILVLKRHCGSLAELTDDEFVDLKHLICILEHCLKTVLGATLCNWTCLLNDFYKKDEPTPHLHLHVRPRYRSPVILNGVQYIDEEFGHHYDHKKGSIIRGSDFLFLYNTLRYALLQKEKIQSI